MVGFSKSQSKILADFFVDSAKGLFLGVAINQIFSVGGNPFNKIIVFLFGLLLSVCFLKIALYFSKNL